MHYGAPIRFHACVHACINIFILRRAKDLQSIKKVDTCCIHEETDFTIWHGSRQTHCNDHAHNIAWVCTTAVALSAYPYCKVKCTHDHEKVTLLTMRVHYTKRTTQQGIGRINQTLPYPRNMTRARYTKHKTGIVYIPRVWPNKVQRM